MLPGSTPARETIVEGGRGYETPPPTPPAPPLAAATAAAAALSACVAQLVGGLPVRRGRNELQRAGLLPGLIAADELAEAAAPQSQKNRDTREKTTRCPAAAWQRSAQTEQQPWAPSNPQV